MCIFSAKKSPQRGVPNEVYVMCNDNGLTIVDTSQLYSISVCTRMYLLLLYSALYLATQLASFSSLLLDNIFDRTPYTRHLPYTHARAEKSPGNTRYALHSACGCRARVSVGEYVPRVRLRVYSPTPRVRPRPDNSPTPRVRFLDTLPAAARP